MNRNHPLSTHEHGQPPTPWYKVFVLEALGGVPIVKNIVVQHQRITRKKRIDLITKDIFISFFAPLMMQLLLELPKENPFAEFEPVAFLQAWMLKVAFILLAMTAAGQVYNMLKLIVCAANHTCRNAYTSFGVIFFGKRSEDGLPEQRQSLLDNTTLQQGV